MPQPPPSTTQGTLRIVRTIHGVLIASIFLYGLIPRLIAAPLNPQPLDKTSLAMLGALSLGVLALGFFIRFKWITGAYATLRAEPDDAASLAQWRKGAVVSAVLGESVVLCGVVIYLIGGEAKQAAPFFAAGLMVMLLWWPKRP
jgi:hypothetical protein